MPIGWQIILRRQDDAVLAPGVGPRRELARCIARIAVGLPLVGFNAPDGHAHLPTLLDRRQAGELARRLQLGLGQVLGHNGRLERARLRPIHDQAHLRNLFRYTLDQQRHHGVEPDPFHEASALPDLLGLRLTGAWMRQVVSERLPRVRRGMLTALLGVDPHELDQVALPCLGEAVAAAVGRPDPRGRTPDVVAARAAGVQLARLDFRAPAVADALGCSVRSVRRLARRAVPLSLKHAVHAQWRLRSQAAEANTS